MFSTRFFVVAWWGCLGSAHCMGNYPPNESACSPQKRLRPLVVIFRFTNDIAICFRKIVFTLRPLRVHLKVGRQSSFVNATDLKLWFWRFEMKAPKIYMPCL